MVVSQSPVVGESQVDGIFLKICSAPKKVGPTNPNPTVKTKVPPESRRWPIRFSAQGDFFFQNFCLVLFFLSRGNTFLIVTTTKFGMSWSFSFGAGDVDFMDFCSLSSQKKLPSTPMACYLRCPRHVSSIFSEVTHGNSGGWSFGTCSEVRDHYMGPIWGYSSKQQILLVILRDFFFPAKSGKVGWSGVI